MQKVDSTSRDIDSWKSFVNEIINQNLYLELDFDIGQLEMDVSREGLQYTKDVIKTLREKTQEIYKNIMNIEKQNNCLGLEKLLACA